MSRGLSKRQQIILRALNEKGAMNVIEIFWAVNARTMGFIKIMGGKGYPSEQLTPTFLQSVYRMMRSLENRGLVARILHRRYAVWCAIEWKDEKPVLVNPSTYDINHVIARDGRLQFRTKGSTWERNYPEPSYSQLRHQDQQKEWQGRRLLNDFTRQRKKKGKENSPR